MYIIVFNLVKLFNGFIYFTQNLKKSGIIIPELMFATPKG